MKLGRKKDKISLSVEPKKELEKFERRYKNKAEEYISNPQKFNNLVEKANKKAIKRKGPLEEIWSRLMLLFQLVKDYINGDYRKIPKGSLSMIVIALIYFISPIDAVIDSIPVIGLIDDAAVLGFLIKQIDSDLSEYEFWKMDKQ